MLRQTFDTVSHTTPWLNIVASGTEFHGGINDRGKEKENNKKEKKNKRKKKDICNSEHYCLSFSVQRDINARYFDLINNILSK